MRSVIALLSVLGGCICAEQLKFPPGFMFGASTSAYQVEGAWNVSGRSESVYDRLVHTQPQLIADGSTGDVSCDSYHQWRRDIEMIEELGLDMYRFSISWTRMLPSGFPNHINEDGVTYYNELINGLLEKGIEPLVTLYHFDLPQSLQDLGGWANPLISDWFADYARVMYCLYAEQRAPALNDTKIGQFLCNKYLLMAHAKAWRIYDKEFKPKYHWKVSLASVANWMIPKTPDDVEATELTFDFTESRYTWPIYSKEGGWPRKLEKLLAENAESEGYPQPRLVPFTPEEIKLIKGMYDFYALNHYATWMVRTARPGETILSWPSYGNNEVGTVMERSPDWGNNFVKWFGVYPEGIRSHLHWLDSSYGSLDILITENGFPSNDTGLNDQDRIDYIKGYLEQVLLAINEGISVISVWSLMDNFEWMGGYTARFGLYAVNFSDPLRTRTPRTSARYYAGVIKNRTTDI